MKLNFADILIVVVIAVVSYSEWKYRVNEDGKREANKAFIGGAVVLVAGLFLQNRFGTTGLYALTLVLLFITLVYVVPSLLRYPRKFVTPVHNHSPHKKLRS